MLDSNGAMARASRSTRRGARGPSVARAPNIAERRRHFEGRRPPSGYFVECWSAPLRVFMLVAHRLDREPMGSSTGGAMKKLIEAYECAGVSGGKSPGREPPPATEMPLDHFPYPTCPISRPPPES